MLNLNRRIIVVFLIELHILLSNMTSLRDTKL